MITLIIIILTFLATIYYAVIIATFIMGDYESNDTLITPKDFALALIPFYHWIYLIVRRFKELNS